MIHIIIKIVRLFFWYLYDFIILVLMLACIEEYYDRGFSFIVMGVMICSKLIIFSRNQDKSKLVVQQVVMFAVVSFTSIFIGYYVNDSENRPFVYNFITPEYIGVDINREKAFYESCNRYYWEIGVDSRTLASVIRKDCGLILNEANVSSTNLKGYSFDNYNSNTSGYFEKNGFTHLPVEHKSISFVNKIIGYYFQVSINNVFVVTLYIVLSIIFISIQINVLFQNNNVKSK
ncbi:hypothetical protein CEQ90_20125 [Lewinellaceae bacterium SD302]|nr:hypothetical protein CEQ90_20125 [Lewinellaceae bacterium SD302]